jgi:hypothetical protein
LPALGLPNIFTKPTFIEDGIGHRFHRFNAKVSKIL